MTELKIDDREDSEVRDENDEPEKLRAMPGFWSNPESGTLDN
jgi:hypothetical protein